MLIGSMTDTTISKSDIISKIPMKDIAGYYLNIDTIPTIISSPIRVDKHPSLGIGMCSDGNVYYKDFSTNEKGDLISLFTKMWGCNRTGALRKIQKDLLLISNNNVVINNNIKLPKVKASTNSASQLKVKIRSWKQHDIDYWSKFGITLKALKWAKVYPISHKFITKNNIEYCFPADKLAYCFYECKEGKDTFKCYQPMNKNGFKWSNSHTGDVVGLWKQIDWSSDSIYICSSLKDALTLKCNCKLNVIYIQGEAIPLSKTVIDLLKERFNVIVITFDGDKPGIKDAEKLSKETGFVYKNTPLIDFDNKQLKDWAEIREYLGKDKFLEIFNNTMFN